MLPELPPELIQLIAFRAGDLSPADVAALRLTSKPLRAALGSSGVDLDLWRSLCPLKFLLGRGWARAALYRMRAGKQEPRRVLNLAVRYAARHGHARLVKALLARGADPTLYDNGAVNSALKRGHFQAAGVLLADPRVAAGVSEHTLELAAWAPRNVPIKRNAKIDRRLTRCALLAKIFTTEYSQVDPEDYPVGDALKRAAVEGDAELARLLLNPPATGPQFPAADPAAERFLQTAAVHGNAGVVEVLLAHQAPSLAVDGDALIDACRGGHLGVVELLLAAKGPDGEPRLDESVFRPGRSPWRSDPLITAARYGHDKVVRALLADGRVDPGARKCTALIDASEWAERQPESAADRVTQELLRGRKFPARAMAEALHAAACRGHFDRAVRLLKAGADPARCVRAVAGRPWPALHIAADRGRAELVRALLADRRAGPAEAELALAAAAKSGTKGKNLAGVTIEVLASGHLSANRARELLAEI